MLSTVWRVLLLLLRRLLEIRDVRGIIDWCTCILRGDSSGSILCLMINWLLVLVHFFSVISYDGELLQNVKETNRNVSHGVQKIMAFRLYFVPFTDFL